MPPTDWWSASSFVLSLLSVYGGQFAKTNSTKRYSHLQTVDKIKFLWGNGGGNILKKGKRRFLLLHPVDVTAKYFVYLFWSHLLTLYVFKYREF